MEKNRRALVVGFDAATFDIIKPMVKEGKLPNFKRLMDEGCYGDLESTFPPVTPPAWASFMTGKNPGKHGVYNFYYHSQDPSRDEENYFVNSRSIKANTIWEILSNKGKDNIVINVPVTYPLTDRIKGIIISGLLTPNNADDFIYPKDVYNDLLHAVGPYKVDSHPDTDWSSKSLKERLDYYIKVEKDRTRAAMYLLKSRPWDFFMVMYSFTDKILHLVYPHLYKDYPESKELRRYIYKTYELADEFLGKFIDALPEDADLFVVSDHGFGHLEKAFMSNRWLVDNGYMTLRKVKLSNLTELYQLKYKKVRLEKLLIALRMEFLRKSLPLSVREKTFVIPRYMKKVSRSVVDWGKTFAYASDYGIRINLKGRESTGIVEPGKDYERLRDEITEKLYELKDPETGEKLVDRVWKKEELFSGPYADNAPDLMYIMKGIRYVQFDTYYFKRRFMRAEHGTHRMNGIFFMKGEGVKKGFEIKGAKIIDVAPTILHSMGQPVPDDMDGKILSESFEEGVLKSRPVRYEKALPLLREEADDRAVYSDDEKDEIMKGLKGLGYWG